MSHQNAIERVGGGVIWASSPQMNNYEIEFVFETAIVINLMSILL